MTEAIHEHLMGYLTARRTASVGNLAIHLHCDLQGIIPVIQELVFEGRLRLSASRCAGGCGSCQGCESDTAAPVITEQTIAISMEKREIEE